jgi:phage shock protein PspC (stress-responsive transcriptional regulator)
MKKVININFQGTVVPIEESSYELLQQYIDSLRRYFAHEEGKDEIINDIESRISELFQERLKNGSTCITDDDVNAIIKNMGRPEEFDEAENDEKGGAQETHKTDQGESVFNSDFNWKGKKLYRDENHKILGGVCSGVAAYFGIDPVIARVLFILFAFTGFGILLYLILWVVVPGSNVIVNGVRKRLYRNPDGKIIGGVCNGLGSYFNVNPWIPRVIFLIPFISFIFRWGHWGMIGYPHFLTFSFSPGAFIIYIILWLVVPEANTTSEKLEMKGEKVDLNSIKNSVLQEMKGVTERVSKLGMEAGNLAKEKGPEIGQQIHQAATRTGGALGNIIVTLFKIFLYFILGCIALSLIVALFAIAIAAIGIFPLKDFVLTNGWQTVFAWGTLIFFIGVPVVGIITFIIRRISRVKSTNKLMRWSFAGLWVLGIICFVGLLISVGRDFRSSSSLNIQKLTLTNPHVNSLEVSSFTNTLYARNNNWFRLEPYATFGVEEDTAYISNIKIRIEKSNSDSFQVSVLRMCNGRNRRFADTLASLIKFNISQNDSVLLMDRAFPINTTDKFRNQYVEIAIAVPVGHQIKIDKAFGGRNRVNFEGFWSRGDWYNSDDTQNDFDYNYGVTYVMKSDGLYTLDGIPANKNNNWNDNSDEPSPVIPPATDNNSYRYNNKNKFDSLKSLQEKKILQMQAAVDSAKAAQQKEVNRMKDSLNKAKEDIDKKIEKLSKGTALLQEGCIETRKVDYPFIMDI